MTAEIFPKKGIVCILPMLLTVFITTAINGSEQPPETVTLETLRELYEPVDFDHRMHMDSFECSSCHHHTTGGGTEQPFCGLCHGSSDAAAHVNCSACHRRPDKGPSSPEPPQPPTYHIDIPGLKGALHLQCLGCHSSEGGPTACLDCHDFSAAGKKRFQVTD